MSGTPGLTSNDTAASPVGSYTITAALGTLSAHNYTFSFANGTLSVTPATLTVTAGNASRIYGAADPTFTVTYSGFVLGQTLATSGVGGTPSLTSNDTAASPVGSYTIMAAQGTLAAQNYTFSFVHGTLSVTPATLVVTAAAASRTYGAADPTFTANYGGFVNGQTLLTSGVSGTPSLTNNAAAASPVGSYTITAALGTLAAQNYSFSFAAGILSIMPATLVVTAADATRTYGAANPAFTPNYSGFVLGQTLLTSDVSGAPSLASDAAAASPVGSYTITAALGTLTAQNYTFSLAAGTLSVMPATLVVTAADASRTYGDADPAFTVNYSGLVNGQTLASSDVSGAPAW